jgi:hypothetical protein
MADLTYSTFGLYSSLHLTEIKNQLFTVDVGACGVVQPAETSMLSQTCVLSEHKQAAHRRADQHEDQRGW